MSGKGTYTWSNGKKFVGEYKNDKKEGYGVYIWPDGREYSGPWKAGKQDGIGKFKSKDGVTKTGLWEAGKRIKWITPGESKNENGAGDDETDAVSRLVEPKEKGKSKVVSEDRKTKKSKK